MRGEAAAQGAGVGGGRTASIALNRLITQEESPEGVLCLVAEELGNLSDVNVSTAFSKLGKLCSFRSFPRNVDETMRALASCHFLPRHDVDQWTGLVFGIATALPPHTDRYTVAPSLDGHTPIGHISVLSATTNERRRFPRKTVRDYVMLEHKLCSRVVFDLARLVHLARQSDLAQQLGLPGTADASICPCVHGRPCTLSTADTILAKDYFSLLKGLPGPSSDSWNGVQHTDEPMTYNCVCGKDFKSLFALELHIVSQPSGLHDRPPECRPRLGGACILFDATDPNPFGGVLAATSCRFASRSLRHESSTSTEIRVYNIGLQEYSNMIPDGYELLLSSDSECGRSALKAFSSRQKTIRHEIRTPEAAELARARMHQDGLRMRGIDLISAHEGAAHDRHRKGTADRLLDLTAQLNNGCDLMAGTAALLGRTMEGNFYNCGEQQQQCAYYFTNSGRALLGDVFAEAGQIADQVQLARLLHAQHHKPPGAQAHCTHVARLAENGDIDMETTAKIWAQLPDYLHAEALRALLGEQVTSCHNLTSLKTCDDGEFMKATIGLLPDAGRECFFCDSDTGNRAHWSHACTASRHELAQRNMNVASALALMGYCFWFDPAQRWPARDSRPELVACHFQEHERDRSLLLGRSGSKKDETFLVDVHRASLLLTLWPRRSTPALATAMHLVLREVADLKAQPEALDFAIIGQIPVELRRWLRDTFDLQQEVLTSAVTMSDVFSMKPQVVGRQWQHGPWTCSPAPPASDRQWLNPCLIVLNEHSEGCLNETMAAIRTASRHTRIVVVIQECGAGAAAGRPLGQGKRLTSRRGQLPGQHAAQLELALFPPHSLMFGHAAGWHDDPGVLKGHSHSWTIDKKGQLAPPTEHHPGFLRLPERGSNRRRTKYFPQRARTAAHTFRV